jgi:hypothetical protein
MIVLVDKAAWDALDTAGREEVVLEIGGTIEPAGYAYAELRAGQTTGLGFWYRGKSPVVQ